MLEITVGEFEFRAQAVIVASGGIGGNHDLVRKNWPKRMGRVPEQLLSGVPAHVDGRMIGISESAGAHVINSDRFAWYIGPTVAFVSWDDFENEFGDDVSIDSEETFGVSTGIDIGLGERFAVIGGLRWLDAGAEDEVGDELSVDPLFARVALAIRF